MEDTTQRRVGKILVERGLINDGQLEEALVEQRSTGRFIGEVLAGRGAASEEAVARSLSEQLGLAYVDVNQMIVEPRAKEMVPRDLCERFVALPLFITQDALTVAMANALDAEALGELQAAAGGLKVKPVFGRPSAIRGAVEKIYGAPGGRALEPAETTNLAAVIERVNDLIARAVEMGASDIHLEPSRASFNSRYRVDGVLHLVSQMPPDDHAAIVSRVKIMANMDIAEKRLPQDGRIRLTAAGKEVDLRIATFPTIHGENLVIRILDTSGGILKLGQLGFSEGAYKGFLSLIKRPYGILLVTGPTGSGKTTTLYAALSEIDTIEKNIITLEDPVEYEFKHIRQSQINVKAGLTFAAGLRSILRQDPDIILIGEIRDKETADIAIHAALTGHLVFSTLHTNDASSAATRLIDMGVEPFLVASSVIGILAQRLIRLLCPDCKEAYTPPAELLSQFGLRSAAGKWFREKGCRRCKRYGYLGRSGIFELLVPDEEIKELIARKAPASNIRDAAVKKKMQGLRGAGLEKVISGQTSVSELLRVTENT